MELYLKNKKMSNLADLLKESKGDDVKESVEVDIEEFKSALSQVDKDMKNLPATAQVLCRQDYHCSFYLCSYWMHECLNILCRMCNDFFRLHLSKVST